MERIHVHSFSRWHEYRGGIALQQILRNPVKEFTLEEIQFTDHHLLLVWTHLLQKKKTLLILDRVSSHNRNAHSDIFWQKGLTLSQFFELPGITSMVVDKPCTCIELVVFVNNGDRSHLSIVTDDGCFILWKFLSDNSSWIPLFSIDLLLHHGNDKKSAFRVSNFWINQWNNRLLWYEEQLFFENRDNDTIAVKALPDDFPKYTLFSSNLFLPISQPTEMIDSRHKIPSRNPNVTTAYVTTPMRFYSLAHLNDFRYVPQSKNLLYSLYSQEVHDYLVTIDIPEDIFIVHQFYTGHIQQRSLSSLSSYSHHQMEYSLLPELPISLHSTMLPSTRNPFDDAGHETIPERLFMLSNASIYIVDISLYSPIRVIHEIPLNSFKTLQSQGEVSASVTTAVAIPSSVENLPRDIIIFDYDIHSIYVGWYEYETIACYFKLYYFPLHVKNQGTKISMGGSDEEVQEVKAVIPDSHNTLQPLTVINDNRTNRRFRQLYQYIRHSTTIFSFVTKSGKHHKYTIPLLCCRNQVYELQFLFSAPASSDISSPVPTGNPIISTVLKKILFELFHSQKLQEKSKHNQKTKYFNPFDDDEESNESKLDKRHDHKYSESQFLPSVFEVPFVPLHEDPDSIFHDRSPMKSHLSPLISRPKDLKETTTKYESIEQILESVIWPNYEEMTKENSGNIDSCGLQTYEDIHRTLLTCRNGKEVLEHSLFSTFYSFKSNGERKISQQSKTEIPMHSYVLSKEKTTNTIRREYEHFQRKSNEDLALEVIDLMGKIDSSKESNECNTITSPPLYQSSVLKHIDELDILSLKPSQRFFDVMSISEVEAKEMFDPLVLMVITSSLIHTTDPANILKDFKDKADKCSEDSLSPDESENSGDENDLFHEVSSVEDEKERSVNDDIVEVETISTPQQINEMISTSTEDKITTQNIKSNQVATTNKPEEILHTDVHTFNPLPALFHSLLISQNFQLIAVQRYLASLQSHIAREYYFSHQAVRETERKELLERQEEAEDQIVNAIHDDLLRAVSSDDESCAANEEVITVDENIPLSQLADFPKSTNPFDSEDDSNSVITSQNEKRLSVQSDSALPSKIFSPFEQGGKEYSRHIRASSVTGSHVVITDTSVHNALTVSRKATPHLRHAYVLHPPTNPSAASHRVSQNNNASAPTVWNALFSFKDHTERRAPTLYSVAKMVDNSPLQPHERFHYVEPESPLLTIAQPKKMLSLLPIDANPGSGNNKNEKVVPQQTVEERKFMHYVEYQKDWLQKEWIKSIWCLWYRLLLHTIEQNIPLNKRTSLLTYEQQDMLFLLMVSYAFPPIFLLDTMMFWNRMDMMKAYCIRIVASANFYYLQVRNNKTADYDQQVKLQSLFYYNSPESNGRQMFDIDFAHKYTITKQMMVVPSTSTNVNDRSKSVSSVLNNTTSPSMNKSSPSSAGNTNDNLLTEEDINKRLSDGKEIFFKYLSYHVYQYFRRELYAAKKESENALDWLHILSYRPLYISIVDVKEEMQNRLLYIADVQHQANYDENENFKATAAIDGNNPLYELAYALYYRICECIDNR